MNNRGRSRRLPNAHNASAMATIAVSALSALLLPQCDPVSAANEASDGGPTSDGNSSVFDSPYKEQLYECLMAVFPVCDRFFSTNCLSTSQLASLADVIGTDVDSCTHKLEEMCVNDPCPYSAGPNSYRAMQRACVIDYTKLTCDILSASGVKACAPTCGP